MIASLQRGWSASLLSLATVVGLRASGDTAACSSNENMVQICRMQPRIGERNALDETDRERAGSW